MHFQKKQLVDNILVKTYSLWVKNTESDLMEWLIQLSMIMVDEVQVKVTLKEQYLSLSW